MTIKTEAGQNSTPNAREVFRRQSGINVLPSTYFEGGQTTGRYIHYQVTLGPAGQAIWFLWVIVP